MDQVQLGVAVCLALSSCTSLCLVYLNQSKDEGIQLPTRDDERLEATEFREDPFDVIEPDDLSEGQPIDEQAFWTMAGTLIRKSIFF